MKEFPVSETAMIRLKAMVSPILYAVVLKQLEDSIDSFPVVEFMFADLFTANTAFSIISTAQYCRLFTVPYFSV